MADYSSKFWVKSYDPHIKPPLKYPTEGLGSMFDKAMEVFPDKPACWFMAGEMPFKELQVNVHKLATFLQKNGLEKGDVVAVCLVNSPQYLIANFAVLLAGGVTSGCSPLLSEDELAYQLNDSNAKFIVTLDAVYAKRIQPNFSKMPNLKGVIACALGTYMGFSGIKVFLGKLLGKIPKGKVKPYPGKIVEKLQDVLAATSPDVKPVSINVKTDLACLQYTGGTTGKPKGTKLTHENMAANLVQFGTWADLMDLEKKGKDVILSAFPYFHIAGLLVCQESMYLSIPQVLIPNPRDTDHLIEEIISKKPTIIANVPTLYLMITNNPKSKTIPKAVLDNIKVYVSGAAPFPKEAILEFQEAMQADNKVMEVYGMTESSPLVTSNPYLGDKKVGTVGLVFPDTEIQLVNVDTGEIVELGEPGEILIKGPQVTKGYLNKPEATAKTIDKNGWLHTGDVGIMDEDGFLRIVDRVKDMLIVGGFKVYSVHVEDILTRHDKVEMAALIGLPDEKRPGNEIVKAFIQLKEGIAVTEAIKEELIAYAAENLAKYEKPKQWEFRDEFPLTTVGKVLKRELRVKK